MVGGEVYYSHNSCAAHDTHVFFHAVGGTLVDGDEVVCLVERRVYNLCWYRLVALHHALLHALNGSGVLIGLVNLLGQHFHLAFEIDIALGELTVDIGEREELPHGRVPLKHLAAYCVGR